MQHAYDGCLRNAESIDRQETSRRFRVDTLLLGGDNEALRAQLMERDNQIYCLRRKTNIIHAQLESMDAELEQSRVDTRMKLLEVESFKVCDSQVFDSRKLCLP